jgi:hypothetical protein
LGQSILHATARIEEFALRENGQSFFGKAQRHKRGVADERQNGIGAGGIHP